MNMKMYLPVPALLLTLLLGACTQAPSGPLYRPSDTLPRYDQSSFSAYIAETRTWIEANRYFLTGDRAVEIAANTPFELHPASPGAPRRGILLVHGLGDSPGCFADVAQALARQGFLVRAMLLPGHGSRPADLMLPDIDDWRTAVGHQVRLLEAEVDEVWLGGFSTGANLVTAHAIRSGNVSGLVLFSPGFVPRSKWLPLAPVASIFMDWLDIDEPTGNYMRYESLTANAAVLYYKSTVEVRRLLRERGFSGPALIVMSDADSVIDPYGVLSLFEAHFTNPESRFIWYGAPLRTAPPRVVVRPGRIAAQRISSFSHMCVLFSPDNPYYGRAGRLLMLENGQVTASVGLKRENVWFSAYGHVEPGKYHAHLTWNPYFSELMAAIGALTNAP